MSTPELDQLAAFQARLLETLYSGVEPETMIKRLLKEPHITEPMRQYVSCVDSRMLVVASELVRKWGQKNAPEAKNG